jgi:hypothetical protein
MQTKEEIIKRTQEIKKREWEELLRNAEMNLHQTHISIIHFSTLIDLCLSKIKEFPEEEKPEEELKEAINELL